MAHQVKGAQEPTQESSQPALSENLHVLFDNLFLTIVSNDPGSLRKSPAEDALKEIRAGHWDDAPPEAFATFCYRTLIQDGKPVSMLQFNAVRLNTIYCRQSKLHIRAYRLKGNLENLNNDAETFGQAIDATKKIMNRFEDSAEETARLQSVLTAQEKQLGEIRKLAELIAPSRSSGTRPPQHTYIRTSLKRGLQ